MWQLILLEFCVLLYVDFIDFLTENWLRSVMIDERFLLNYVALLYPMLTNHVYTSKQEVGCYEGGHHGSFCFYYTLECV